jgi:uncharacterized protein (DUF1330 family)
VICQYVHRHLRLRGWIGLSTAFSFETSILSNDARRTELPKGYVIALIRVTDERRYDQYRALATEAIWAHRGKVLVRGGRNEVMEGLAPERTVVVEFNDLDTARQFHSSVEYSRARAAREGAADVSMFVVQGVDS